MQLEPRRVLVGLISLILGLAGFAALAPPVQAARAAQSSPAAAATRAAAAAAPAAPDHLVISEVNGDQSGVYRTNWVELYNPTDAAVSLGSIDTSTTPATVTPNYFLCYASQAGTTCSAPYKLYGTIMARHHFLIEIYDAGGSLPAMPAGVTPDLNFASTDPAVNPSQQAAKNIGGYSTGGQILLLDAAADPAGAYPTAANDPGSAYSPTNRNLADPSISPSPVVDAIGYTPGSTAASLGGSEGWASTTAVHSAPVENASHWDERIFTDGVPQDTNDNAADFQVSQRDPISQVSSRVAVAPISNDVISPDQPMTPVTVAGSRGVGTLSYAATGLPDGVTIDPGTGVISGTPAAAGTLGDYPVTVTVTDQTPGTPDTATATFTLTISAAIILDPIANVSGNEGTALTGIQVQPHGGTAPYSYAATGLPAGVSIGATSGAITGTPAGAVGKYSVHVTVTDSGTGTGTGAQQTASADFTLTELPSLAGPAAGDPLAGLTINEVAATGTPASDFVELYNTGAAISGASADLADSSGAVYHLTGLTIAAGGFAVAGGSDLDAAGLDLAASDTLYLSEAGGKALLDHTAWTSYQATSWERFPDGTGDFYVSPQATQGSANAVPAELTQDDLVVAAVYGADGTTFNSDWVELYNPTDHDISLGTIDASTGTVTPNYYQCYRSNAGTSCSSMKLYGTVSPHHYFLIWDGHNADTTVDAHSKGVPPAGITPDLDFRYGSDDTNTAATAAASDPSGQSNNGFGGCNTGGQLWLLNAASNGTAPAGNLATAAARATVVDGVGWTSDGVTEPAGYETAGLSSGTNNACVIARKFVAGRPVDSDDNNADFALVDPASFTLHSEASDRVAVTPVPATEISLNEAMEPVSVHATAIYGALTFAATGLPAGVTIDPGTGVISGTPDSGDALQAYPVTVTVGDAVASDTTTVSFTLTLGDELRLDPVSDTAAVKGAALTPIDVRAHGATPPYAYAATGLPAGVSIDPVTGVISGTPDGAVGRYPVHVTATDASATPVSVSLGFTLIELPPAGGPAAGDPLAGLRLNEVRATGIPASDFVELYNTGSAVTGAQLMLVDGQGHTYPVPSQDIAAGGYAVVQGSALDSAGFDLTADDSLYLTETDGTVLDQTTWTSFQTTSWARTTDGTGEFAVSAFATPGKANSGVPVIKPNDLLVSEVNYDNNSTDYYEYSEITNTTGHPIDFAAYGLTLTKSGAVLTFHDPSDTSASSPVIDPVIPAHGTQLVWWVENQYLGVKTTAQFLANYGLPASTSVVLAEGFTSMANSGGDHSYYISVNQGTTLISQAWVDTPCAAGTLNGAAVCTATNANYAEHYAVPADRASPVAGVWYNSLHSGGDDINFALKPPLSTPGTVDLEQLGFTRDVKISAVTNDAITLHNTGTGTADLSGYVLEKDNSAAGSYTLPAGTTLAAGADLTVTSAGSGLTGFGTDDFATLLAPQGYDYTDGVGLADTTGPFLHTLAYDASSGQPPVTDPTTGLPLPPAGGLYRPAGVSAANGTVYASNTADNVVASVAGGANTILAGSLEGEGDTGDGGPAAKAFLYQPGGTATDAAGDVFIADSGDNVIREITPDGNIRLFAGTGTSGGAGEAVTAGSTPTTVSLWHPDDVAVDAAGDVFIADTFDNRVLEVTTAGAISVVAGTGTGGYSGDGGAATRARLSQPAGVAVDAAGDVYIADSANNVVRRVDHATGDITTVAGNYLADEQSDSCLGGFSGDGGPATSAQLNDPESVALDGAGDLFIADTFNNAVREVTPGGTISTLVNTSAVAGAEGTSPTGSGALPGSTRLDTPSAVAVDASSNVLYVADTKNNALASVANAGHSGSASGPVEPAAALASSRSPDAASACQAMVNGPVTNTARPAISGPAAVGSRLTAGTGTWTPAPDKFTYQWLRDGQPIAGATRPDYAVRVDDGGHALSVAVTAVKAGFEPATATSAAVSVPLPGLAAGTPSITGIPVLGAVLAVSPGRWRPSPDAFSYQWLRDGQPVAGATGSTYRPVRADVGHKLTVTVTGTKAGYAPASATSAAVRVAKGTGQGTLTRGLPAISGTYRVGATLTANAGTWKAGSSVLPATDLTYQWLRNGWNIRGATAPAYTLTAADRGTQISVRVTGRYPGYATASAASASHLVSAGLLTSAGPAISGTFRVGEKLTASAGTWQAGSVTLTGPHLAYQWLRNGRAIAGATTAAYTLAAADDGAQISVQVTGSYPGYATVSRTSTATAPVTS